MNKNLVWIALGGLAVYFVFFKKENKQITYDPSKDADNATFSKETDKQEHDRLMYNKGMYLDPVTNKWVKGSMAQAY